MSSVREQIITNVIAALNTIPDIFTVIDAADTSPKISEAFDADKCVAEIAIESDQSGEEQGWGVEKYTFKAVVNIHWPPSFRPNDAPHAIAADLHFAVYALYTATEDDDGTWGALALRTRCLGGGGYGFSDLSDSGEILQVESAFEVTYRHARSQPGVTV